MAITPIIPTRPESVITLVFTGYDDKVYKFYYSFNGGDSYTEATILTRTVLGNVERYVTLGAYVTLGTTIVCKYYTVCYQGYTEGTSQTTPGTLIFNYNQSKTINLNVELINPSQVLDSTITRVSGDTVYYRIGNVGDYKQCALSEQIRIPSGVSVYTYCSSPGDGRDFTGLISKHNSESNPLIISSVTSSMNLSEKLGIAYWNITSIKFKNTPADCTVSYHITPSSTYGSTLYITIKRDTLTPSDYTTENVTKTISIQDSDLSFKNLIGINRELTVSLANAPVPREYFKVIFIDKNGVTKTFDGNFTFNFTDKDGNTSTFDRDSVIVKNNNTFNISHI